MEVSWNRATPKSSPISIGFSIINYKPSSYWGIPMWKLVYTSVTVIRDGGHHGISWRSSHDDDMESPVDSIGILTPQRKWWMTIPSKCALCTQLSIMINCIMNCVKIGYPNITWVIIWVIIIFPRVFDDHNIPQAFKIPGPFTPWVFLTSKTNGITIRATSISVGAGSMDFRPMARRSFSNHAASSKDEADVNSWRWKELLETTWTSWTWNYQDG